MSTKTEDLFSADCTVVPKDQEVFTDIKMFQAFCILLIRNSGVIWCSSSDITVAKVFSYSLMTYSSASFSFVALKDFN
jgi:hypothetical protein